VTVVGSKFVRAWPGSDDAEGVILAPLPAALMHPFPTDAHFAAYSSAVGRRLSQAAIGRTAITMGWLIFDVDTEGHAPITAEWCAEMRLKIERVAVEHPSPFVYFTAHGCRIIWRLAQPFAIASSADAAAWRAYSLAGCDLLAGSDVMADRSCSDWSRLFRLPQATRTPGGAPEDWPTIGDLAAIGVFALAPAMHMAARSNGIHPPPAPGEQSEPAGPVKLGCDASKGSLFDALSAARMIVAPGPLPRSYRIVCPRQRSHTTGTVVDGSTLLHLPKACGDPGFIDCKHRSCTEIRTARQWRRALTLTPALRAGSGVGL
jgi:hypothetical protein